MKKIKVVRQRTIGSETHNEVVFVECKEDKDKVKRRFGAHA